MTRDPLEHLLRDADDADEALRPHDAALADRVRQLAARRARRTRLATGGIVTACLVAIVAWAIRPGSDVDPPAPPIVQATRPATSAAPDPRAELMALRQRADRAAAMAERMLAAERRSYAPQRIQVTSGGGDVAAHVERAAFVMVYQAQRMPTARGAESPAAEVYRQVAKSFPNTRSAELARQRLSELEERKDG